MSNSELVLTVVEVAKLLRINRNTVYRKVRAGSLPGVKVGRSFRFYRPDIEAWLRRRFSQDVARSSERRKKNPFLKAVGSVSDGSLASGIDDTLYS